MVNVIEIFSVIFSGNFRPPDLLKVHILTDSKATISVGVVGVDVDVVVASEERRYCRQ